MPPVRYAPLVTPTPKEFVEPNSTDSFIWWLFRHRCVMCHLLGSDSADAALLEDHVDDPALMLIVS